MSKISSRRSPLIEGSSTILLPLEWSTKVQVLELTRDEPAGRSAQAVRLGLGARRIEEDPAPKSDED